jgi:DNA-directed RNA polymerase subunit RPC12/RpoP
MITPEELNAISKSREKRQTSALYKSTMLMLLLLTYYIFGKFLPDEVLGSYIIAKALYYVPIAFLLMLFIIVVVRADRRDRDSGYKCPNCNMELTKKAAVVIATGNCPFCGKKAIVKDNYLPGLEMCAEDFHVIAKKYIKQLKSAEPIVAFLFIICLIAGIGLSFLFQKLFDSIVFVYVFIISGSVAGLCIGVIFGERKKRIIKRNSGYHCINCGKQLAYLKDIVIATSNCPFCRSKVLVKNE